MATSNSNGTCGLEPDDLGDRGSIFVCTMHASYVILSVSP